MGDIVFQYLRSTTRYRDTGDPEGDAYTVTEDGRLTHEFYVVGYRAPVRTVTLGCIPEMAEEVKAYISAHSEEIAVIPFHLDNGSIDGYYDKFTFGDHCITSINILGFDTDDPKYAERYSGNMIHERNTIDHFQDVYGIIRKYMPEVHIPVRSAGIE